MGTKISAMTPKTSADGTEIIPVSDSLASKSITTAVLKTYVVDAIEANISRNIRHGRQRFHPPGRRGFEAC